MTQDKTPSDAEIEAAWTDATGSRILPYPDDMLAFARAVLAKWGSPVVAVEPKRVFIVATGEEHEGEATYTRYDDAPPPLCDSECLYTAAPTPRAARKQEGA